MYKVVATIVSTIPRSSGEPVESYEMVWCSTDDKAQAMTALLQAFNQEDTYTKTLSVRVDVVEDEEDETEPEEGTLGPCGCVDYHMADCPIRTGSSDYGPWEDHDPYYMDR